MPGCRRALVLGALANAAFVLGNSPVVLVMLVARTWHLRPEPLSLEDAS